MARRAATGWVVLVLVAVLGAGLTGCVRRRMTIRSNPPGAFVYVDNYEVGTTPCAKDFTYYGTRQIKLVKDGYDTLIINQPIPAPWYEIPPIDFVSENLVPGTIRDERTLNYTLTPQVIQPTEQLLSRAERLRQAAPMSGPIRPVLMDPLAGSAAASPTAPAGPAFGPEPLPAPPAGADGPGRSPGVRPGQAPGPATLPPRGTAPIYAPPPLP